MDEPTSVEIHRRVKKRRKNTQVDLITRNVGYYKLGTLLTLFVIVQFVKFLLHIAFPPWTLNFFVIGRSNTRSIFHDFVDFGTFRLRFSFRRTRLDVPLYFIRDWQVFPLVNWIDTIPIAMIVKAKIFKVNIVTDK